MVSGPGLMAREELGQQLGGLGQVDTESTIRKTHGDCERDEQPVVPHRGGSIRTEADDCLSGA